MAPLGEISGGQGPGNHIRRLPCTFVNVPSLPPSCPRSDLCDSRTGPQPWSAELPKMYKPHARQHHADPAPDHSQLPTPAPSWPLRQVWGRPRVLGSGMSTLPLAAPTSSSATAGTQSGATRTFHFPRAGK